MAFPHVDEEPVRCLHVRRIGRNLNAEQLVVQLDELVPDGSRYRRHVRVDAGEQPTVRIRQEVDLAHDDRAAHICRVPFGHPGHYRRDVPARSVMPSESMPPYSSR